MVEQSQAELVEVIATKQREAERHAQELARGLENELSQLRRRSNELEAHAQTQDRVVFLQVQIPLHDIHKMMHGSYQIFKRQLSSSFSGSKNLLLLLMTSF